MARIFFTILLLLCPRAAGACSFIWEPALYYVQQVDAVFEGDIQQIYLNGVDVRFRDFNRFLDQSDAPVNITVRVAPRIIQFGNVPDSIDIHTTYDNRDYCFRGPGFKIGQKTWVVRFGTSRVNPHASLYYFPHDVITALKVTAEYKEHVEAALDTSALAENTRASITHELTFLLRLLNGDKTLKDGHFFSTPQMLANWPLALLEARLTFLDDMRMPPKEIIDTQSAILLKR